MNLPLEFFRDNVHRPLTLSNGQATSIIKALETNDDRHILRARPNADGPGREYAEEVISSFHSTVTSESLVDRMFGDDSAEPDRFSYELWFHDSQLEFVWTVPNEFWYDEIRRVLTGSYPRLSLNRVGSTLPTFNRSDSIAGGTFTLYNNQFIPIKGTSGPGEFERDKPPLRLVTSEVAGQPDTTAVVQVLYEPAPEDWRTNTSLGARDADTVASHMTDGNFIDSFVNPRIEEPTEKDHRIAQAIHDHEGDPAFYVTIRYLVFAPNDKQAQNQAASIGNAYRNTYYNKALNQRLTQRPLTGNRLLEELHNCIEREHSGRSMSLTIPELAAVAHIPNNNIDTPSISWTRRALTSRAPSEAPRKPETIDARPYSRFGPETATEDHLSANAPQLPPAEGAPEAPPPDPSPLDEPKASSPVPEDTTQAAESPAPASVENYEQYGRPQERINERKQGEFDRIVRGVRSGDLSLEEIKERYGDGPEAENLISLIEREIEWRESAPDDTATSQPDATTEREQSVGRSTGAPNNLPTKPGDYDDYRFQPDGFQREWMKDPNTKEDRAYEIAVKKEVPEGDDQWYMGRDVKNELFDSHIAHPDSPIWLGWMHDNRVGVREIGLPKQAWFRHMTMFGMTGTGKSTSENNLMNQIARKGHGFVYIDPKADGVEDIVQQLPDDRLDDVIWIEPGSVEHDKVVGINFLEPAYDEDHPKYDREVASIVDDLVAILKGGDYWGPKMQGITTNFARAMIRSDINYTLLDMYFVLLSKEARLAFAQVMRQERKKRMEAGEVGGFVQDMANIEQYTEQIAEMDQEEVDAVVRRIQHWIEDPISRGVVAHREGTVNITDAVEDGKIILVSIDVDSKDIKEVVTTAIMRRVWAAIKARDEVEQHRDPFFAFIDEFDDVVTPEMDIEKMLSKARSGKMGVNLACQNPSQIPEGPLDQMFNNARTLNTFNIGGPNDAALISKRLGDEVDPSQVTEIPQYTIYTRVLMDTEDGHQLSNPLALNTFADYPPQRSRQEAHQVIETSLEQHGVDPLEETLEEASMILYNRAGDIDVQRGFLQSVWQVQIQRDEPYVALSAVDELFKKRINHSIKQYPEGLTIDADWIELYHPANNETDAETVANAMNTGVHESDSSNSPELADGGYTQVEGNAVGEFQLSNLHGVVRLTSEGKSEVLRAETHRASPSETHGELLKRGAFEWFTRAGFFVNIISQHQDDSVPDAEGLLPIESTNVSLGKAQESLEKLESEYPLLAELSNGQEIAIEAEVSLRKPAGPLKNIARAVNNSRRPVFIVPDGRREDLLPERVDYREFTYWAHRLYNVIRDPLMVRRFSVHEDDQGRKQTVRTLYNTQEHISLSTDPEERKFPLLRNGKECLWQDHDGEYLILYDGGPEVDGKQRGRITPNVLDNPSANAFENWCRYDRYDDEWVVYREKGAKIIYQSLEELTEDWQRVYRPFHPGADIDGDPADVDPLITILREPEHVETLEDAMPAVYHHPYDHDEVTDDPETHPLIPEEYRSEWDANLIPGFNPIEQTPEFLEDDGETVRERLDAEFGDSQLMTEEITSIDDVASATSELPDYDPSHEPQYDFGGKDPTTRAFWIKIWKHQDQILEEPLELDPLRDRLLEAAALAQDSHEPAIRAGIRSGQLLPSDIGFFLATPTARPEVIVDDPTTYLRRSVWEDIWRKNKLDEDDAVPRHVIEHGAMNLGPFTGEQADETIVRAAIELAIGGDVLETADDNMLTLGPPEIPEKWKTIWEKCDADIDDPVERHNAAIILRASAGLESVDAADDQIQAAINKHVLYETDAGLRINNPMSDEGPSNSPGGDDSNNSDDGDNDNDAPDDSDEPSSSDQSDQDTCPPTGQKDDDTGTSERNPASADSSSQQQGPTTGSQSSDYNIASDALTGSAAPSSGNDNSSSAQSSDSAEDTTDTNASSDERAGADSDGLERDINEGNSIEEPMRVAVNDDPDEDIASAPGADASNSSEPSDDQNAPPDDYSAIERWGLTPTEQPPAGWQDAFEATIDAYHARLEATIDANVAWNELVANYRSRHHERATCSSHDTYVATCQDCQITAPCAACSDDTPTPIARVEWESCANHDTLPMHGCPDCLERQYCVDHAQDRRTETEATSDVSLTSNGPVEYVELVTCYRCKTYTVSPDSRADDRCYCQAHTHVGPLQRLPETAADYFTGPNWDGDNALTDADYAAPEDPHRHRGARPDTIGRQWDRDVVDDRRLGWVPGTKPYEKPIIDSLLNADFTIRQLLATGLFRPHLRQISRSLSDDDDPTAYSASDIAEDPDLDLAAALEAETTDLDPRDVLQPRWSGRPIFPAFNQDGNAVYAYARQQPGRQHPDDTQRAKYLKLPDKAYIHAAEPIYGADTLETGTPTIITEGVADAIAAYSHGFPVLSPVTVQFKEDHHAPLLELLDTHDVTIVLMIQDNEPGSFSLLEEEAIDIDAVETAMEKRNQWLDSDSQDITEHIDAQNGPGPIGEALEIDGIGPGLAGALTTGAFLEENGITALQVELPRFGAEKVDLDDYLTSGLHECAPPLPSFQTFVDGLSPDQEQTILAQLQEAKSFTDYYATAVDEYLGEHMVPEGTPEHEWPEFETVEAWYDARRELRDSALLSAAPHATDDFDLEPVAAATGPSTFNTGFLGTLLDLGSVVLPVPTLARRPRGARVTVSMQTAAGASDGESRISREWVLEITDRHETAVSLLQTDAGRIGHFDITPLFDGPTIQRPDTHPKFEAVMRTRARNEHEQLTDHVESATGAGASSSRSQNPLFELSLTDVAGVDEGYRGPNPLGHVGDSRNYFVVYNDEVAFDFKRNATYNALTYLAVAADVRSIRSPGGRFDSDELLETWLYAKRQGLLGSDAPVPSKVLNTAAIDMGIADADELIEDKSIGAGDDDNILPRGLPEELYNKALRNFEDHYGVDPGKSADPIPVDFKHPDVTEDNSLELFGELFLDDDPEPEQCDYDTPRVSTSPCWEAYEKWCDINGVEPASQQKKQQKLDRLDADGKGKRMVKYTDDSGETQETTANVFVGVKMVDDGWALRDFYHQN